MAFATSYEKRFTKIAKPRRNTKLAGIIYCYLFFMITYLETRCQVALEHLIESNFCWKGFNRLVKILE